MIDDTIEQICITLENSNIEDFEQLPYWCDIIQSYNFVKFHKNGKEALPHLRNMIDYFPYAKSELHETLANTPQWPTIENFFDTLQAELEDECRIVRALVN